MNISFYNYLVGKSKKDVLVDLGDEFNFYPDDLWTYFVKKDFFGKNIFLLVLFENEHVSKIKIKKTYSKSLKS